MFGPGLPRALLPLNSPLYSTFPLFQPPFPTFPLLAPISPHHAGMKKAPHMEGLEVELCGDLLLVGAVVPTLLKAST